MGKSILFIETSSLAPLYKRKWKRKGKEYEVFRLLGSDHTGKLSFLMTVFFVHGLIHLLGFVHAFQLVEVEAFRQRISQPIGILWFITTVLFLMLIYIIAAKKTWWWILALIGIATSQILILLDWQDAMFGTLVNLMILAPIIIEIALLRFTKQTDEQIQSISSQSVDPMRTVITEEMLAPLPTIIQKWLTTSGMVGKEHIQTVYMKHTGLIKLKPAQKDWYLADSEQFITINQPAFIWKVNMPILSLLSVYGRDSFMNGKGKTIMKLAAIFPVAGVTNNSKVDESSLQRYLLEMPWYPSLALHPDVTWKQHGELSATATLTVHGITGAVTFFFNKDGELLQCSALRYKDSDEKAKRLECIGEVVETRRINGIKIPTEMTVSWILENQQKFTWYEIMVEEIKYNVKKQ